MPTSSQQHSFDRASRGSRASRDTARDDAPTARQLLAPQSLGAEQSTLGAMLMERDAIARAREWVTPDDFYRGLHRTICAKIYEMDAKSELVDLVTLSSAMGADGTLDNCGGGEYLSALLGSCPSSVNIDSYARVVLDKAQKRRYAALSDQLSDHALNGMEAGDISVWLRNSLDELSERQHTGEEIKEWSAAELMETEFPPAKVAVAGLIPIGLTIFAGAPKIGKSWLSYNLALAVAQGGKALGKHEVSQGTALYLALEDHPRRLKSRLEILLQGENGTLPAPKNLKMMCDWPKLDEGGLGKLDAWLSSHDDCRLVVIDTLQKIRPRRNGDNIYDEDYEVFAALKRLADKHEVAIVVVMHTIKRDATDVLQTIGGSTGQTGAADAILVLQRARKSKKATLYFTGRDIGEGEAILKWAPELGSYTEVDEDEAERAQMSDERAEIIKILQDAPWPQSPRDIAEMLEKKPGAVRKLLFGMKTDGQVKAMEGDKYALPDWSKSAVIAGGRDKGAENKPVPPEPDWAGAVKATLDANAASFSMFWRMWHDRYDSPCDQGNVEYYFPLWKAGSWPSG